MKTKQASININFLHLILAAVAIATAIMLGSFWNHIRTQSKLAKIEAHVDRVYTAHQEGFVNAIKTNARPLYSTFLTEINSPEKGIYHILILIREENGTYHVQNSYSKMGLSVEEVDKLNLILSSEKAVSTTEDFKFETWGTDNSLYAFTPIIDNGVLLGYVVLSVRKSQNI